MISVTSQSRRDTSSLPVVTEAINEPRLCSSELSNLTSLLQEVARGNQRALSILYTCTAAQAYSLALRIVRSKECAQEIVCDVFVYVWQNSRTYDAARGSVRSWLAIIVRNRAIDRVRKNSRYRFLSEQLFNMPSAELGRRPEEFLSNYQDGRSVYAALAHLPPLRQTLLRLAFFEGLTHEEIAFRTGLRLGTVKSHVRRSLRSLRKAMDHPVRAGDEVGQAGVALKHKTIKDCVAKHVAEDNGRISRYV